MSHAAVAFVAVLAGAGALALVLEVRGRSRKPAEVGAGRILFPFTGSDLSLSALDAAIRLAKAESATLVPAFLAVVPRNLPLASPLPKKCESALPVLEAIEQRAARAGVVADPRIERGRTSRHALGELLSHETYDRILAPAGSAGADGFSAEDIAWLLDHATDEIVVFRADLNGSAPKAKSPTPRLD